MWTKDELLEIRDRAEQEANIPSHNILWLNACIDLAMSASNLLSLTERICDGKITALMDDNGRIKLPHPSEE